MLKEKEPERYRGEKRGNPEDFGSILSFSPAFFIIVMVFYFYLCVSSDIKEGASSDTTLRGRINTTTTATNYKRNRIMKSWRGGPDQHYNLHDDEVIH